MRRSDNVAKTELIVRRSILPRRRRHQMKRLLIIGLTFCAFGAPTMPVSAMPSVTPYTLGHADRAVIQVKGGHAHGHGHGHGWGHHGGRGHHYGWYLGHHYGWRHHRHWW